MIEIYTIGRRTETIASSDGTEAVHLRMRANDNFQFGIKASDAESGVASMEFGGYFDTHCSPEGNQKVTVRVPFGDSKQHPLPLLDEQHRFVPVDVAALRSSCPPGTQFYAVTGVLNSTAANGANRTSATPTLHLTSAGPDSLAVATFNLYQPGNHPDSVYEQWGDYLNGKVDLLLLTEVVDQRRAELIADRAGLASVVSYADLAIATNGPIRDVTRHTLESPNANLGSADSSILVAEVDIGRYPHKVVVAHWGIRDANDELFEPWRSAPNRLAAAQWIVDEVSAYEGPVVVGGDFNAYSGLGPQLQPGSTAEIDLMRATFLDPFGFPGVDQTQYCSDQRIDYILVSQGDFVPRSLVGDCEHSNPSDHPIVLGIFDVP